MIFNNIIPPTRTNPQLIKGRNKELINERNLMILHRYYYYVRIQRKRYDDVLDELAKEFFLTCRRIIDIVSENAEKLNEINKNQLSIKDLKTAYPFFIWEGLAVKEKRVLSL